MIRERDSWPAFAAVFLGAAAVAIVAATVWMALAASRAERQTAREDLELRRRFHAQPRAHLEGDASRLSDLERRERDASHSLNLVENQRRTMAPEEVVRRLETAVAAYDAYLAERPSAAGVWYRRGRCHQILGRREQADADYDRAIELDPKLAETVGKLRGQ